MKAIQRLLLAGYTRSQIASGLPGKTGVPLIRLYERGERFPRKRHFVCLVEMGEARGLTLLARDFIAPQQECEPEAVGNNNGG